MHTAPTRLAMLLLPALLGLGNAQAGNSQASVNPPGGFASACASGLSAGISYTPGLDLVAQFGGWNASCQTSAFEGAAGQASAAAQWTSANVGNHAAIQAAMGHIHLQADNAAPQNIKFPVAVSGGGWSESIVVDVAGHTGQAATWLFKVAVDGSLSTVSGGSAGVMVNAYKNEQELMSNVPGWDNGGSDNFTTDRQRAAWRASRGAGRDIVDEVTFAVPITLGQSFVWGVYATAQAGLVSYGGVATLAQAAADFSHTLRYGGSAGVLIGGVNYDATSLVSASGIDWRSASPVPEPATWALMLAGTGLFLARRRRSAGRLPRR